MYLSVLFICVGVLLSVIGCVFVSNVYLSGCVFVRTVVLMSYTNYQTDKSTTGVFLPVVLLLGSPSYYVVNVWQEC